VLDFQAGFMTTLAAIRGRLRQQRIAGSVLNLVQVALRDPEAEA
jgi:hypothetical protein